MCVEPSCPTCSVDVCRIWIIALRWQRLDIAWPISARVLFMVLTLGLVASLQIHELVVMGVLARITTPTLWLQLGSAHSYSNGDCLVAELVDLGCGGRLKLPHASQYFFCAGGGSGSAYSVCGALHVVPVLGRCLCADASCGLLSARCPPTAANMLTHGQACHQRRPWE